MSALRLRDEKAFAYLYDHYSGALYSVVNTVLSDTELANDVLQTVLSISGGVSTRMIRPKEGCIPG